MVTGKPIFQILMINVLYTNQPIATLLKTLICTNFRVSLRNNTIKTRKQSCNKSVSWYLGYWTFLEENLDISNSCYLFQYAWPKKDTKMITFFTFQLQKTVNE